MTTEYQTNVNDIHMMSILYKFYNSGKMNLYSFLQGFTLMTFTRIKRTQFNIFAFEEMHMEQPCQNSVALIKCNLQNCARSLPRKNRRSRFERQAGKSCWLSDGFFI